MMLTSNAAMRGYRRSNFNVLSELPSEFAYTGNGGNGTYFDASGNLQTSVNNTPRIDHNPVTLANRGIMCEGARTNLVTYSNATAADWSSAGGGTETDLSLNALGFFDGVSYSSNGAVWHKMYPALMSLDSSTQYAVTLFYRAGTSGNIRVVMRDEVGGTETTLEGTIGADLSQSSPNAGPLSRIKQELLDDGSTYRLTFVWEPNFTNNGSVGIGPFSTTIGETIIILGCQVEEGGFASSFIPTSGSTVTRTAENILDLSLGSRNYFRQKAGAIVAIMEFMSHENHDANTYPFHAAQGTGFANSMGLFLLTPTRSKIGARTYADNVRELNLDIHGFTEERDWPLAVTWKNGGNVMAAGGPMGFEEEALANDLDNVDRMYLGNRANGSHIFGWIKHLAIYNSPRNLTQIGRELIPSSTNTIIASGQSLSTNPFDDQTESKNGGEKVMLNTYDEIKGAKGNIIVNGGTPGSAILKSTSSSNYWYDEVGGLFDGPAYLRWLKMVKAVKHTNIEAIEWDQGEADVGAVKATYKAAGISLFTEMRSIVGDVPVIIRPIGRRTDTEQNGVQMIREVQWEWASENSWIHLAPEKFDCELEASGVHLTNDGEIACGARTIRKILDVVGETVTGGVDGPQITAVDQTSGTIINLTVTHDGGTDFTPTTAIEGFKVFDDSVELTLTSVQRIDANTIRITSSTTIADGSTVEIYYGHRALFGVDPTKLVIDNDSNGNLPLRSFYTSYTYTV